MFPYMQATLISNVYFFNRYDAGGPASSLPQRSVGMHIYLVDGNGHTTETQTIGYVNNTGTATDQGVFSYAMAAAPTWPTYPNMSNPVVAQQQADNWANWVRYVTMVGATGQYLNLKELMVFDVNGFNVALGKNVSITSASNGTTAPSAIVDGIINMDTEPGNLWCSAGYTGNPAFTIDLGGVYRVSAIVVFNRIGGQVAQSSTNYLTGFTNTLQRIAGATISFANAVNVTIASVTIPATASAIMTFNVTLPTASPTPTSSPTATSSSTRTTTSTSSSTASPSATLSVRGAVCCVWMCKVAFITLVCSLFLPLAPLFPPLLQFGATPSNTPTPSVTPSNTPSSTRTPSNTPTQTPTTTPTPTSTSTPLSPYPYKVTVSTPAAGGCLNFFEVRVRVAYWIDAAVCAQIEWLHQQEL